MARIVATPGAGDWFKGGLVAYDREVKSDLLGVTTWPGCHLSGSTADGEIRA